MNRSELPTIEDEAISQENLGSGESIQEEQDLRKAFEGAEEGMDLSLPLKLTKENYKQVLGVPPEGLAEILENGGTLELSEE